MANPSPQYERLTKTVRRVGQNSALWLGSDHLFELQTSGFTERYRRFNFREIQALLLERSRRRLWWSLVFGALGVAAWAWVLAMFDSWTAANIVGGIFIGFIGWNLALGPGCRIYLVTGVQTTPLAALVRYPQAHRALARLQPIIVAAQADLTPPLPPPIPPIFPAVESPAPDSPVASAPADERPLP